MYLWCSLDSVKTYKSDQTCIPIMTTNDQLIRPTPTITASVAKKSGKAEANRTKANRTGVKLGQADYG